MRLKVGEVAEISRVSVRTLHHYDHLGLLEPSDRSESGYRLYTRDDLDRLQRILFYREIGFPLDRIAELMNDSRVDRLSMLREQHRMINRRIERLVSMRGLIERTITGEEGGQTMSNEEMFEVFGDFDPEAYRAEAEDRWGNTEAYAESARRTAGYGKKEWKQLSDETAELNGALVALMDEGVAANDPKVTNAVDRLRLQIDKWFYPCSKEMHAELAEMYVSDDRFRAHYEAIRTGLAGYIRDAARANHARG